MKRTYLTISIINLLFSGLMIIGYHFWFSQKIASVDINRLYEGFLMKQELQKKVEGVTQQHKSRLDSLENQLRMLSVKNLEANFAEKESLRIRIKKLEQQYQLAIEDFRTSQSYMNEKYNNEVMMRINQYIGEYTKLRGYDIILMVGTPVMVQYTDREMDITEDVLIYVNKAYNGE